MSSLLKTGIRLVYTDNIVTADALMSPRAQVSAAIVSNQISYNFLLSASQKQTNFLLLYVIVIVILCVEKMIASFPGR